jgi:hypothetical protein
MARAEGLKGAAYEKRMDELMEFGSPAWIKAVESSEEISFQQHMDTESPRAIHAILDRLAVALRRMTTTETDIKRTILKNGKKVTIYERNGNIGTLAMPFINTPLNIFKVAIEMSPIGGMLAVIDGARALKIKLAKGNMTREQADLEASALYDRARLVKDVTNQVIALGVFYALGALVDPGDDDDLPFITGTTDWKNTAKGVRDNQARVMPALSIRIGKNNFMSYGRIEPFATAISLLIDLRLAVSHNGGYNDKSMGEFMHKVQNQLNNKTFLSGVSDIANAYTDPERFGSKLAANVATGLVPNLIRQPIREADPFIRNTKPNADDSAFAAFSKQVGYSLAPGYAPPQVDAWGNPVRRHRGDLIGGGPQTDVLVRVLDPLNLTIGATIDPVDLYIDNYNRTAERKEQLSLEPIRRQIEASYDGRKYKLELSQQEYTEVNERVGQQARAELGEEWDGRHPTPEGAERIKRTFRRIQDQERDRMRAEKLAEAISRDATAP